MRHCVETSEARSGIHGQLRQAVRANGLLLLFVALACQLSVSRPLAAQDNYEIQVYPAETLEPDRTMVELHTNYTFTGSRDPVPAGERSPVHTFHETIEITHGFTPWFETGFYIFTSVGGGYGAQWVGDHIRPRSACRRAGTGR